VTHCLLLLLLLLLLVLVWEIYHMLSLCVVAAQLLLLQLMMSWSGTRYL
jgi:hypothetical protein